MIFTKLVKVSGAYNSRFVFESNALVEQWRKKEFVELCEKYGCLTCNVFDLDGLQIGDTCHVLGEGDEEFKIKELIKYSPHRYGFVLDCGWSEEVAKCYVYDPDEA